MERPQFFRIGFQLGLDFSPYETAVAVHVFLKRAFNVLSSSSRCLVFKSLAIGIIGPCLSVPLTLVVPPFCNRSARAQQIAQGAPSPSARREPDRSSVTAMSLQPVT